MTTTLGVLALVLAQAEDPGLWFVARTAPEAYLQAALRTLHEAVETEARPLTEEIRRLRTALGALQDRIGQPDDPPAARAEGRP